jgi:hypothetical protein
VTRSKPKRVQLRRTNGWRLPAGCINVARPSRWGNPFRIGDPHPFAGRIMDRQDTVDLFRSWATDVVAPHEDLSALRGHDLACWCALDEPLCHADVWLALAR